MRQILPLLLFFSWPTFATVTVANITGVSKFVTNSDGSYTVYGGIQGGAVAPATFGCLPTDSTCNTCVGNVAAGTVGTQHRQMPCNPVGVFKETIITIFGTQTTNPVNGKFFLCNGTTEIDSTANLSEALTLTWAELCQEAVTGGDSTCTTNINQTVTFGVGTDCNNLGSEKVNIKVITRSVDVSTDVPAVNTYTPPPIASPDPDPAACTTTRGACFFRVFPGDAKVYIDRTLTPGIAADFPATDASGVTYDNLILFLLETGTTGDDPSNDITTFNTITTAQNYGVLSITSDGDVSTGSVDGLTNEARVCFKMGSQDTTGNIDHISSTDCTVQGLFNDPLSDCRNVCASPSEVIGLLSDTNCFIATAAYGSSLDPHVQILRNFKNEYLVPYKWGRKLVKAYYSLSPAIAKWVTQHDWFRSVVRAFLWPLILLVQIINQIGMLATAALATVLLYSIYKGRRVWR